MTNVGPDLDDAVNVYEDHPELSKLQADVLWEYAKLAKNVKTVGHRLVGRVLLGSYLVAAAAKDAEIERGT